MDNIKSLWHGAARTVLTHLRHSFLVGLELVGCEDALQLLVVGLHLGPALSETLLHFLARGALLAASLCRSSRVAIGTGLHARTRPTITITMVPATAALKFRILSIQFFQLFCLLCTQSQFLHHPLGAVTTSAIPFIFVTFRLC